MVNSVVLISPNNRRRVYQGLADKMAAAEPPVWAGLIATYVRRHSFGATIIDANADQLMPDEVANKVVDIARQTSDTFSTPLVVIVVYGHQPSASTQIMTAASQTAAAVRLALPTARILMLGGHVAALPFQTLRDNPAVDYVATGEGLESVIGLLEGRQVHEVPGIMYRLSKHEIAPTKEAPLVMDVTSEMPMLAWDLLPMEKYRAHNWHCFGGLEREPYAAVYTTLGCPYKCTFCCIQAPFKSAEKAAGLSDKANSYRFWNPIAVVDQLQWLAERYGVTNIKIADEMFVLNRRHVSAICEGIIERGLKFNIWAYARVDTVKDGMVDLLKKAGFNWLAFGIESAVESVRDGVDKGFTQDEMFKTLEKVRAAGINIGANYIFGLPDDNYDTMQATLDFAIDINAEYANFYSTMAYPGSPLYEQAVKENWQLPTSWDGYSQHSVDTTPLPTKHLTAQEIVRFRDNAFQAYFTNSKYLDMMAAKFGQVAVDEIKEMCSHKLQRN